VIEYVPKPRFLDAAIPSHIVKDQPTELLVLIRLPDSTGLSGTLLADVDAEASPEDLSRSSCNGKIRFTVPVSCEQSA